MYVRFNKPYKKPVSLRGEVDLLLHFPFGGLIGGELLPHAHIPKAARNIFVKAKPAGQKRDIKYH